MSEEGFYGKQLLLKNDCICGKAGGEGDLWNNNKLLQKKNKKLVGSYSAQKNIVGKRARKLVKSVPTHFVLMIICISRAILNQCLSSIRPILFQRVQPSKLNGICETKFWE